MSALVLDAGALIAVERRDRSVLVALREASDEEVDVRTTAMVVAQVWRGGSGRQAPIARLLSHIEVRAVDDDLGRRAGVLLGAAGTTDPIDASLVLVAEAGDRILTSDPDDIGRLATAAGRPLVVAAC